MKRYRMQRRLIGPLYRPENVINYEKEVNKVMKQALVKIKSLNGAKVDLKEWMHIIVVECLGEVVLSWSPGMLKQGTDFGTSAHSYQGWRRKSVFGLYPLMAKLEMCSSKFGRLFSVLWGITWKPPTNFRAFFPVSGLKCNEERYG